MDVRMSAPHVREENSVLGMYAAVLVALLPALLWSVYCFGWRVLLLTAVAMGSAVACEEIIRRFLRRTQVTRDGASAVSGMLFAALLPPAAPLFLAALGGFLASGIKAAFGGTGKNPVNPALASAGLLYLVYSASLTAYTAPFARLSAFRAFFTPAELASLAGESTPLAQWKAAKMPVQSWYQLLSGDVPGPLGAGSAFLLLAGGLYLLANRVVSRRAPLAFLTTVALTALIQPLKEASLWETVGAALLSGGTMLGAFFFLGDPVTDPVTRPGKVCYGVIAGLLTALFRAMIGNIFAMVFAILIANLLSRPLDFLFRPRPLGVRAFQQFTPPVSRRPGKKETAPREPDPSTEKEPDQASSDK